MQSPQSSAEISQPAHVSAERHHEPPAQKSPSKAGRSSSPSVVSPPSSREFWMLKIGVDQFMILTTLVEHMLHQLILDDFLLSPFDPGIACNNKNQKFALVKWLQSYIQANRFAPSSFFDEHQILVSEENSDVFEDGEMEDGELESEWSSYRVLSSKTLANVVEALIGVYYVEGGKVTANHLMKWIGIHVKDDPGEIEGMVKSVTVTESVLKSVDFVGLERALTFEFKERGLFEAITHASRPSSCVSCYQRLEFVGDAVLDHLSTRHVFVTYTSLSPGWLTDLRAAAVHNENFASVAVKLCYELPSPSIQLEGQAGSCRGR